MASEPSKQPASGKKPVMAATTPAPNVPAPTLPKAPPLYRPIDWIAFALTSLIVFIGYMYTLAPDMTLQDSGELAVASMYAGVPHPPGYPVWTIYTWFFTKIIPFSNIAWRVGVSSAFAGALSCGLVALMVSRGSSMFIESVAEFKGLARRSENLICLVSGLVSGLLIGYNGFMWSQSVIVEVYSLSMLTVTMVLAGMLHWAYSPNKYRYLYFAWFSCGLAFNNHQSLLVMTMAMIVLMIVVQAKLGRSTMFWVALACVLSFLLNAKGDLSLLSGNTPVMVVFVLMCALSTVGWIWLSVKTRANASDIVRDLVTGAVAILSYLIWGIGGLIVCLSLLLLGFAAADIYYWSQKKITPWMPHWRKTMGSFLFFMAGAAFYLYMPLASMTNPPLNWGYPRTVGGFVHAFTRGQYERIHPTSGNGRNIAEQTINWVTTYAKQVKFILIDGPVEEFSIGLLLIGLVPLLFFKKLQPRERAWLLGLLAFYIMLGPFLLELFNPAPDRQSLSLNKPFFIASHFIIAMAIGYGIAFLMTMVATNYEKYRLPILVGVGVIVLGAIYTPSWISPDTGVIPTKAATPYVVDRFASYWALGMAVLAALALAIPRKTAPLIVFALVAVLTPVWTVAAHWSGNEQRGHFFGYWFGHDMFTPPFKNKEGKLSYARAEREELMKTPEGQKFVYPEMPRNTILFGGTDPGRFCPTYMIFCESFIPPKDKPRDPEFDRRDVYLITQNALADGTYLQYIRAHYNRSTEKDEPFFTTLLRGSKEKELNLRTNLLARTIAVPLDNLFLGHGYKVERERRARGVYPPAEINTPSNEDSQRCFQEYMQDAQARMQKGALKPGEDVRIVDNRVQVSGQVAVMAINALLAKVIFEKNPTNEFFVEESFPLEWMYPHLTPFGIIMKINRNPLPELPQDVVDRDHKFWSDYSERLIGNWITYDTPIKDITEFAERVYVNKDYNGFKGDPRFVRDEDGQKAFSKLRSSIAGVYAWRINSIAGQVMQVEQRQSQGGQLTPAEKNLLVVHQRMMKEADFAFKQAFAFCPYSPEALYRYVQLLAGARRFDEAILLAKTAIKVDPNNGGLQNLISELSRLKGQAGSAAIVPPDGGAAVAKLEAAYRANPADFNGAVALAQAYANLGRTGDVMKLADDMVANPKADATSISFAAQIYQQLNEFPKLEKALERWTKLTPTPEAWLDYAAAQAVQGKQPQALTSLGQAMELNRDRLKTNSKAENLGRTVENDGRFASLKNNPDFQKLLATNR
jgi:tetratricopeptide (TPR) repeat protein